MQDVRNSSIYSSGEPSSLGGLEQSNCKHALTRQGNRIKNIVGIFFNGAHTEITRKQNNSRKNE
jgi:hypothetical protein